MDLVTIIFIIERYISFQRVYKYTFLWPENRFSALKIRSRIPQDHWFTAGLDFGHEIPEFSVKIVLQSLKTMWRASRLKPYPILNFFDDSNFLLLELLYFDSIILSPEQTDFKSDKTNYHLIAFGWIKHFGKFLATLTIW